MKGAVIFFLLLNFYAYTETDIQDDIWEFEYFKYKTQVYKLGEIRNRADFKFGLMRFVYTDVREMDEKKYNTFGFSFPWLTAGPLSVTGLLKEIYNPLGYTSVSNIFRERTGINLNASFTDYGKKGFTVEIIPDNLGFYWFESSGTYKYGGFLSYKNDLSAELLFSFSIPEPDQMPDSWFIDSPVFPGGKLFHNAFRLSFNVPALSWCLSGCFSYGEKVKNGHFININIEHENKIFKMSGLTGLSSVYYFDPDGDNCNYKNLYNAQIWIKVLNPFFFGGEYWHKTEHPGFVIDQYTESKEGYSLKTRINFNLKKTLYFIINSEYTDQFEYNESGESENKKSVDSDFNFNIYRLKLSFYHKIGFTDRNTEENDFKISARYLFNSAKISSCFKYSIFEKKYLMWDVSFIKRVSNFNVEITAGMDYYDFYLTLGWEFILKTP